MVNYVAAVAYHFCLALPAAFTQPGAHFFAEPCTQLKTHNLALLPTLKNATNERLRLREGGEECGIWASGKQCK